MFCQGVWNLPPKQWEATERLKQKSDVVSWHCRKKPWAAVYGKERGANASKGGLGRQWGGQMRRIWWRTAGSHEEKGAIFLAWLTGWMAMWQCHLSKFPRSWDKKHFTNDTKTREAHSPKSLRRSHDHLSHRGVVKSQEQCSFHIRRHSGMQWKWGRHLVPTL